MKKFQILVAAAIIMLSLGTLCFADDAVLGGTAKTVYPIKSANVTMVSEKIDIKVVNGKSKVTCVFVFKNDGKAEQITMGFPEELARKDWGDDTAIHDFKAWVNTKAVTVTRKKGGKPLTNDLGELEYPYWHTFKVSFKAKETLTVKNTYWVSNSFDSSGGIHAGYVLKTGSVWKNKIGKVDVQMAIAGYMPYFGCSIYEEESYKPKAVTSNGVFKWHMENLEPTKDIHVYYQPNYDRDTRLALAGSKNFWKNYYAMNYKEALKEVSKVAAVIDSPDYDYLRSGLIIAVGGTYYYNNDLDSAMKYLMMSKDELASLYYQTLIYQKTEQFAKMKQCLDAIKAQEIPQTMKDWVNEKYNTYKDKF